MVAAVDLQPPPLVTLAPCPYPVTLPERELTQADVEGLWGKDRESLRQCRTSKATIQNYYALRDEGIVKGIKP